MNGDRWIGSAGRVRSVSRGGGAARGRRGSPRGPTGGAGGARRAGPATGSPRHGTGAAAAPSTPSSISRTRSALEGPADRPLEEPPEGGVAEGGHLLAGDGHPARGRPVQTAAQKPVQTAAQKEDGGLARVRPAEDGNQLALADAQRGVAHRHDHLVAGANERDRPSATS